MRAMVCQLGVVVGRQLGDHGKVLSLTSNGIMTDDTSKQQKENPECKCYFRTIEPSQK